MKLTRLTALLLVGVLSLLIPQASAATYSGDVLVAVNTALSSTNPNEGSFSSSASQPPQETLSESAYNLYTDPEGETEWIAREVAFPALVPLEEPADLPLRFNQVQTHTTSLGTARTFKDIANKDRQVTCLYVGQHCTVWGATDDDAVICINAAIAQEIGEHFDGYYDQAVTSFGEEYDADGDGKLAILCYDINADYPRDINSYTAGFFRAQDLIDPNGRINGINFGSNNYINGMDCIHLDTYPGMGGKSEPLQVVSRSYSTLVHEFQHLINFSWQISGGTHASYVGPMDSYLDEAFSMAAEHMVCGADACASRISYFNSNRYTPGYPLTYWQSDLSNYANSYLFGQYLRTRYGTLTDTDGSTLFQEVLAARTPENENDTLSLIANLLETTPERLVQDFWAAVYLKQDTGVLGFGGEDWADTISPYVYTSINDDSARGIYNGGARFYALGPEGFVPNTDSSLRFLSLDETGIVSQQPAVAAELETSPDGTPVSVTVQSEEEGYAMVAFYDDAGRMKALRMAPILPGTNTVDLSDLEGDLSACTWKILLTDVSYNPMCEAFTS